MCLKMTGLILLTLQIKKSAKMGHQKLMNFCYFIDFLTIKGTKMLLTITKEIFRQNKY